MHTIARWLTVALAGFRYIIVCHHALGRKLRNLQYAKLTILAVFLAACVTCIPYYVMYTPVKLESSEGYWFKHRDFVSEGHKSFYYWLFGVYLKLGPCVILTVFSSLLIRAMCRADQKHRRLKSQGKHAESERTSEHNRTIAMLVSVVFIFLMAELPQGILHLLSGVDTNIFLNVYVPLGDIWDIVMLVNTAVSVLLYCIMSRESRQTFKHVFFTCEPKMATSTTGVAYSSD